MVCMELSLCCSTDINIHIDLRRVSQGISVVSSRKSSPCTACCEHGIAMEPMKGKWTLSRIDLWYTEVFCIPKVTSVFFSSCDSVLGDSLVFCQANRGS